MASASNAWRVRALSRWCASTYRTHVWDVCERCSHTCTSACWTTGDAWHARTLYTHAGTHVMPIDGGHCAAYETLNSHNKAMKGKTSLCKSGVVTRIATNLSGTEASPSAIACTCAAIERYKSMSGCSEPTHCASCVDWSTHCAARAALCKRRMCAASCSACSRSCAHLSFAPELVESKHLYNICVSNNC
jgi:hypothetical protein